MEKARVEGKEKRLVSSHRLYYLSKRGRLEKEGRRREKEEREKEEKETGQEGRKPASGK